MLHGKRQFEKYVRSIMRLVKQKASNSSGRVVFEKFYIQDCAEVNCSFDLNRKPGPR